MTDIESKITEKLKQYGFSVGDLTEEELAALRDEIEAEAQGVIILDGVLFHKDIYRK